MFTQYGETEETLPELGELRNAAEGAAERQQAETERQRVAQLESLLAQYRANNRARSLHGNPVSSPNLDSEINPSKKPGFFRNLHSEINN